MPALRIVVTGGGSGIGAATCRRLAKDGARVAVLDRNGETAAQVAAEIGGVAIVADVKDPVAVDAAVQEAAAQLGGLTGLINNAGIGALKPLEQHTDKEWSRLIDVNLTGAFHCLRAAVPVIRAAGGGVIVNVASVSGTLPTRAGEGPYSIAKAGLIAMTKSAALELGPAIRVNSVSPAFIETPLTTGVLDMPGIREGIEHNTPLGRIGSADDVADVIAFLCSDDARFVTGHDLIVDGGASLVHAQADPMLRGFLGQ